LAGLALVGLAGLALVGLAGLALVGLAGLALVGLAGLALVGVALIGFMLLITFLGNFTIVLYDMSLINFFFSAVKRNTDSTIADNNGDIFVPPLIILTINSIL